MSLKKAVKRTKTITKRKSVVTNKSVTAKKEGEEQLTPQPKFKRMIIKVPPGRVLTAEGWKQRTIKAANR